MRKRRFFALICTLLLLLAFPACKKNKEQNPNAAGDSGPASSETESNDATVGESPFSVRFETNGSGFDTATGTLFTADGSAARDFSEDLTALRDRLTECNAFVIGEKHSDLTYQTLSGGHTPTGANTHYTVSFTADGNSYTITIDRAAIDAYKTSNSHVSNISALVDSFVSLTTYWNGTLS